MSNAVTRRTFLKATAASTLPFITGCDSTPQTPAEIAQARVEKQTAARNNPDNLFNKLSTVSFTDENGQSVNMNALQAKIGDNPSTVTFGFGECKDFCPIINGNLHQLRDKYNTTNIVISINPEDNFSAQSRAAFKSRILNQDRSVTKVITLFPQSVDAATQLSIDMGGMANTANPQAHDTTIHVFDAYGTKIGSAYGMARFSEIDNQLGAALNNTRQK